MNNKYLIGIDIGGTTVKIAFVSQDGNIHTKWEIPTNTTNNGASIPTDIWNSIKSKLKEYKWDSDNIVGIGVGAPGFVVASTGCVAQAVNIGWKDYELGKILHELSGVSVFVENDANIAALGENWKGAGNLSENLIAITLGTGVGGGIIVNGKIINGENGTAGEIGHITVEENGASCNCGRKGCLETIASATGIVRLANEAIASGMETKLKDYSSISAKTVFDLADAGDEAAQQVVNKVVDVLGMAIANASILINPSKIVIGGGVSKAGDKLITPLKKSFTKYALPRINDACEFNLAVLGNDAGVIGGAYLVKNKHSL